MGRGSAVIMVARITTAHESSRFVSSIKWLLCSTVCVPLFHLFYDFIASSSSPPRFVPHGRA